MKKLKTIFVAGVSLLVLSSCSFFDAKPEDFVAEEDNYKAKTAIYADFMGLLGTLQDAVTQLVLVSELRGDLMMPTDQAPSEFVDVYMYDMSNIQANYIYDPAPFYRIVMNCNDFLRRTVKYNSDYPGVLATNIYRQMIGGAVALRTWAYLTLGKIYGGAVYYDYAMTGEIDISHMRDKWKEMPELIKELIYFMNNGVDNVNGVISVRLDEIFGLSGNQWRRMTIAPDALLTELYLWEGAYGDPENPVSYEKAVRRAVNCIADKGVLGGGNENRWSLAGYFQGDNWKNIFKSNFGGDQENEAMTTVFWDMEEGQDNMLMKYFNNTSVNDLYYLKATSTYANMVSGDKRSAATITSNYGERMITKFNQNFTNKFFYLYRGADLYFMIAEGLTALERFEAADQLINQGTKAAHANGYGEPFDAPIWWHGKFSRCPGVRGRVGASTISSKTFMWQDRYADLHRAKYKQETGEYLYETISREGPSHPQYEQYLAYRERRMHVLDSLIAQEVGRELGFEAKRFFTLVRMGIQLKDPDVVAQVVSKKFDDEDDAYAAAQLLRDPETWFINYDLQLSK